MSGTRQADDKGLDRRQATGLAGAGLAAAVLAPGAAQAAAATTVTAGKLHGRDAFTLANRRFSLSLCQGGGFIGDVRLVSKNPKLDISPMRVPAYQTIDPYTFDVARDGPVYGTGNQRRLMSGYMGHYTCFPQFGHSEDEFAATGYGQHGEAILVKWQRMPSAPEDLVMRAYLPNTQYNFSRSMKMLPDETVAYVTETAENLAPYDRPLQWVQHVTMGPPWAEIGKMFADASVDQVVSGRGDAAKGTPWPQALDNKGQPVDPRVFAGATHSWLMQHTRPRNWVTAYHKDYNVLFGHIYDARINPWVLDWQSNQSSQDFPGPQPIVARAFCWGDSSAVGGVKAAVQESELLGTPTYSWIDSRATRSQGYAIFMAEIPSGWRGTADIAAGNGVILITEKETGRTVSVKAAAI